MSLTMRDDSSLTLLSQAGAKLHVLVVDDHSLIREGLKILINAQPDMEVACEAADGEDAVRQVCDCSSDLVVLDISMPKMNGAVAAAQIRQVSPQTKIVALSMHEDVSYLRNLLEAGVAGYVLKRSAPQVLLQALRHVAIGEIYLDPAVTASVAAVFTGKSPLRGETFGMALSAQEEKVLRLSARGHTNREIAEILEVSVKTVESYKARSMEKLGLTGRTDLVRLAATRDWLGD